MLFIAVAAECAVAAPCKPYKVLHKVGSGGFFPLLSPLETSFESNLRPDPCM